MKPTLPYLILCRDIIVDNSPSTDVSAIRIFDTLYLPKEQKEYIYPLNFVGRLYLNSKGIISNVKAKLTLLDPLGQEIGNKILEGKDINSELGMNIISRFWIVTFKLEGKYTVNTSFSVDGTSFTELDSPVYFQVKKSVV